MEHKASSLASRQWNLPSDERKGYLGATRVPFTVALISDTGPTSPLSSPPAGGELNISYPAGDSRPRHFSVFQVFITMRDWAARGWHIWRTAAKPAAGGGRRAADGAYGDGSSGRVGRARVDAGRAGGRQKRQIEVARSGAPLCASARLRGPL